MMVKWFALWVSGWPGYHGTYRTVGEVLEFTSLRHASKYLRQYYDIGYPDSSLTLWSYDPRVNPYTDERQDDSELFDPPYPDRIMSFGPRGGIRIENA